MDDLPAPLRDDPILFSHIQAVGQEHGPLSLEPAADPFRRLVTSIVNQQLSVASARTIRNRLFDAVDITPAAILEADPETLRECGLSRQKAEYVQNVAYAFGENDWSRNHFQQKTDAEVVDLLTDIRGVGTWTAKMFLMFALARPDVFPVEDLGIRNGMTALYGAGDDLTRSEMTDIASAWAPHRSLASLYLWHAAG
jgi:DNA-3-methyladenine glycosylase II